MQRKEFDKNMVSRVEKNMKKTGVKFLYATNPLKLEKSDKNGRIKVTYKYIDIENSEDFDTVIFAIGRQASSEKLKLKKAGVSVYKDGKIEVNDEEQTSVPHIYAIGDVIRGYDLDAAAVKAGYLLARRIYSGSTEKMDYNVPTTIFTPIEYACVGLSEEEAQKVHGEENVQTFNTNFRPVEWHLNKNREERTDCYVKVLVQKET